MATYETTTHPLAFAHMEGGMKTVYVMPDANGVGELTSGDRIEFADLGSITIGMVRRYATLEELMEAEGYANVVPEADDVGHAIELLRGAPDWNESAATERGVLALRVRTAKRKS